MSRRVVLAQYFATEEAVLVFVVRSDWDEPQVAEIPVPLAKLRAYVDDQFGVSSPAGDATPRSTYKQVQALDLESWQQEIGPLVQPVADWTAENDLVWLVPHDVLHYLPLHAVEVGGKLLVERNSVFYTPSASVMRYCRQKHTARPLRTALVVGDSGEDLPFAREEALTVSDTFGSEPLLGRRATLDAFMDRLREFGDGLGVLHVACHGHFDGDEPLRSGIRFSEDHAGEVILTAEAIFGLELACDLVVLSACESGVNARRPGDELLGLTRALIYAGTPSVLVSLWRVDDLSTFFLMKRFYECLEDELDKAQALQRAQLDIMRMTGAEAAESVEAHAAALREHGDKERTMRFERLAYKSLLGAEQRTPRTGGEPWRPFSHLAAWAPFILVGEWR